MEALGVGVLCIGTWLIYCGFNSLLPTQLALAIVKDPSNAASIVEEAVAAAKAVAPTESQPATNPASSSVPTTGGTPQAYAQSKLSSYGWGQDQWSYLNMLWTRESGWNPSAKNGSSGAYGIPQALPASKMQSAGSDYLTNPDTQINWGLNYIKGRYGNPQNAWTHELQSGWY